MKEPDHYTDEDIQSYHENTFTGNVSSLETHIQECELCSKKVKAYSAVWSFAKNDLKTEPLRIDLAYAVADKVFPVKQYAYVFEKILYGALICLGIVCLSLCLKYMLSTSIPPSYILQGIPVGLFLWVSYMEIKIINKKLALYNTR